MDKLKRILAISDIHGCYDEFKQMLTLVDYHSAVDQLILLGDYVDRGKDNKQVVLSIKELVEEHDAIAIKGNHDQMLCDWLDNPEEHRERYFRNGGIETIKSFLQDVHEENADTEHVQWAEQIAETNKEIIHFLKNLPLYYETEDYVFVHAGIDPAQEDWKLSTERDFIWIREPFLHEHHPFKQTFIHGHTPATMLHDKPDIFYGDKKICIDGACVYGHQLNCLEIKNGEYKQYMVKKIEDA